MGITTTLNQDGGTLTVETTDAISQFNANAGLSYLDRHGTLSTLAIGPKAIVDTTRTTVARTISAVTMARGARLRLNSSYVTLSSGVAPNYRGGVISKLLAA
jgi:hypothetical protein